MPELDKGGNIVQPYIEAKLSLRCSPYTDVEAAADEVKNILEASPHEHGAKVTFTIGGKAPGFAADPLPAWYRDIVDQAAIPIYGAKMLDAGKGGTIGFLNTIQKKLEGSIIHNAGLFDPAAKGHAPDESLDVIAVKKFTTVMAYTLQSLTTGYESATAMNGDESTTATNGHNHDDHSEEEMASTEAPTEATSGATTGIAIIAIFL